MIALSLLYGLEAILTLALVWRVGSWSVPPLQSLLEDHGLPYGSKALDIAAHRGNAEFHLDFDFGTQPTFLVFGWTGCTPCEDLLRAATTHPAVRSIRRVYIGDTEEPHVEPDVLAAWELYRFHNEGAVRRDWRAPISPYFHVIDPNGRVVAKGVGNRPAHLDRLLAVAPPRLVV